MGSSRPVVVVVVVGGGGRRVSTPWARAGTRKGGEIGRKRKRHDSPVSVRVRGEREGRILE